MNYIHKFASLKNAGVTDCKCLFVFTRNQFLRVMKIIILEISIITPYARVGIFLTKRSESNYILK